MATTSSTAGAGDDIVLGGGGDDRFVWWTTIPFSPAHGNDSIDGELGWDTLEVHGPNNPEVFTLAPSGQRVMLNLDVPAVALSVGTTEFLDVDLAGGNDRWNTVAGLPTIIALTIDGGDGDDDIFGGAGDDTLLGGNGADAINSHGGNDIVVGGDGHDLLVGETGDDALVGNAGSDQLTGGDGNDRLSGNAGVDTLNGGNGNDVLIWNSGDGSDTAVSGGSGLDTFEYHGSAGADQVTVDAAGSFITVTSSPGPASLSLGTIEVVDLATLGGNDVITVGGPLAALLPRGLTIDAGDGNDHIHVGLGDLPLIVNGGTADLDTLHVRAFALPIDLRPTTIWVGGGLERDPFGDRGARCLRHPERPAERHDRDTDVGAGHDVGDLVHHARPAGSQTTRPSRP